MLGIKLELTDNARSMLKRMPELVRPALFKGMKEAMIIAEREGRINASGRVLNRRTGRLRSSITSRVDIRGDRVVGVIGTNVIYARIHELGGVIEPKKAKALKFNIPGVGWRTVKRVIMPARPFLRPAITDNLDEIGRVISHTIEEAFSQV